VKPEWWYPRLTAYFLTVIATVWVVTFVPARLVLPVLATGVAINLLQVLFIVVEYDW
jgi:hypothetical protein